MPEPGNPDAFIRLLMQHEQRLFLYILPLTGHEADARDVLQETASAMWKKFDQYDPGLPFLAWAKGFARNEVLMHHRRRSRYTFLSEELLDALAERQDARVDRQDERSKALDRCMGKLPEDDRRLIERRYFEQASVQELADEQISPNMLYKALGRIRRNLLQCIEQTLQGAPS